MIPRFRFPVVLLALAFAMVANPAQAADNLDCVDSGYAAADQARLDDFAMGFDLVAWGTQGPPADIMALVRARAATCAELHGWSVEAAGYAMMFKMGRIGLVGMERNGALSPNDIAMLQGTILPEDIQKGKRLFEQMASAYGEGKGAPLETPDMFIGQLIKRSGIAADRAAAAGGWIGAVILCERFAELFATA